MDAEVEGLHPVGVEKSVFLGWGLRWDMGQVIDKFSAKPLSMLLREDLLVCGILQVCGVCENHTSSSKKSKRSPSPCRYNFLSGS